MARHDVMIYLKSGERIALRLAAVSIQQTEGNKLTALQYTGIDGETIPLYLCLDEIAAVVEYEWIGN